MLRNGQEARGKTQLEAFLARYPTDVTALVALAEAHARLNDPAGATSSTSRMLLARFPRGAIQVRCRRPRPAVCSVVTNQQGPASPRRACTSASALVEPMLSKATSRYPADVARGPSENAI